MPDKSPLLTRLAATMRRRFASPRETLAVLLSACASIAVHGHFRLPGMGELDAARFGRIAFLWHVHGKIAFDDVGYQIRTSTLYLQMEKVALDHGVAMHALPNFVNWVSVVLGTACSVALYVLFRKLTTRPVAVAATLVHALTPGFFLGNLYGMPTVPGMFFFVLGLIAFLTASRSEQRGPALYAQVFMAWLCMTLAMTLKSDLVLGGGAFLGVALIRPTQRLRWACAASVVVVGATLGSLGYARLVVLPSAEAANSGEGLLSFLKNWNSAFATSFDALLTDSNNTTIVRCAGGLLFCVVVFSLIYGLVMGGVLRRQALLALVWGLPPILAWGIRFGNSARHNVPAYPPLILFAMIFLFEIVRYDTRKGAMLVAGTMFASYFSNTSGEDTLRPQSNLLGLSEVMARYTSRMHDRARALAERPAQKRVVIAGYADPYTEFEVLAATVHPSIEVGGTWVVTDGDRTTIIDYSAYDHRSNVRTMLRNYGRNGFEAMSLSYKL